jgi:hypothetical protein
LVAGVLYIIFVAPGNVRWVRGDEYGVETLVTDESVLGQVQQYMTLRAQEVETVA